MLLHTMKNLRTSRIFGWQPLILLLGFAAVFFFADVSVSADGSVCALRVNGVTAKSMAAHLMTFFI